ncbi:hypothetical protein Glove_460g18 [Diversispora epigaea]|uniref:Uncharacterized protein n=1 Tax=Diversispora epigaea TaxID=1348612 RepID=A0A397GPU7_9GLOM|nr:hypothetical protein Glove_460g18 [Diversispora epigaea]
MAKTLNEGTYQSTVIVLTIRAVLKNLPLGPLSFISTSERQSIASADRRGTGRHPDIMFIIKYLDVFFELMYIECSRLLYQFRIIGVQIAEDTLHLNVLIRDKTNVHRYYHIQSAKIPVQFSDEDDVIKFVETLLFLRNILITNISLLCHGTITSSQRLKEGRNPQSTIDSLKELNSDLVCQITELRKKFAEVETENIKLKQDKEKIELRFMELEQKDKEKSILITKLQHDVSLIKEQSMQDKNTECHQTVIDTQNALSTKDVLQSSINSSHFVSASGNDTPEQTVLQCEDIPISNITDNTLNSNDTHEQIVSYNEESNISSHFVTTSGNSDLYQESVTPTPPIPAKTISMEEKEENEFLDSMYKEQVSKEIMERIREKKLRDQNLSSDISSSEEVVSEVSVPSTSISRNTELRKSEISAGAPRPKNSHRKKGAENISQMICESQSQKLIPDPPNDISLLQSQISSTVPLLTLAQLFNKATDAEYGAIHANQEEILCWCYYGKEFITQVNETIKNGKGKVGEKKAKGIIYDKMLEDLSILRKKRSEDTGLQLPEISRKYLQGKTQKAVKIYKLFEKIGVDKIKYIKIYSANSISELTNDKIQTIINHFSKNTDIDLPDNYIVSSLDDLTETSAPSIQPLYTSNSGNEISEDNKSSSNTEQYLDLYYEYRSKKNIDYYGVNAESPCPICKLNHEEENGINGEYKDGSYYIKCEASGIDIIIPAYAEIIVSKKNIDYYGVNAESPCPICKLNHEEENGINGEYKDGSYYIKCEASGIDIIIPAYAEIIV